MLDSIAGSSFFSIIYLYKGYWHFPVQESDREKKALVTPDGLFQFRQKPFGLTNAPASFQRLMDTVLVPLKLRTCLVYMDDILGIFTQLRRTYYPTASVLQALSDASLMLNPLK